MYHWKRWVIFTTYFVVMLIFSIPPTNYAKGLVEIWVMNLFPGVSQLFLQCDLEDVAFDIYVLNKQVQIHQNPSRGRFFFNGLENSVDAILSTYI